MVSKLSISKKLEELKGSRETSEQNVIELTYVIEGLEKQFSKMPEDPVEIEPDSDVVPK